ncbi:PREDICTED: uncharacterized protein LOC104822949 isoform X2 [Tarenaya hassleriana]|uniref:uncharacterized protein LOC104822949 isoform X2 n=1 Tax=Tarenaya hassleriana TaxID=28532 RepID=UPI00053C7B1F|nr:PREDICTED: uncharacterized protein LOC104822949 isoform X2 [Tarenaya hassleriana]
MMSLSSHFLLILLPLFAYMLTQLHTLTRTHAHVFANKMASGRMFCVRIVCIAYNCSEKVDPLCLAFVSLLALSSLNRISFLVFLYGVRFLSRASMGEMEDMAEEMADSSNPGLEVSVSFGRFENDSLSWEKFSAFSPNKYLEEVEKCATPGSVAQKKAYFEAHYKKIAERKAELLDHEKLTEKKPSFRSILRKNQGGLPCDECTYGEEDKHVIDIATEVNQHNEETVVVKECQTSVHAVNDEFRDVLDRPELEKPEEIVVVMEEKPGEVVLMEEERENEVKEDIPYKDSNNMKERPVKEMNKAKDDDNLTKTKDGNTGMNHTRGAPMSNTVNKKQISSKTVTDMKTRPGKGTNLTSVATKEPASPLPKARGFSTPRVSKPASMPTSRSSVKKEKASNLPRNKQTAPKSSLHMSLSVGPSGSDPTALTTTRKSLIMDRMGDKDIVKCAFKTFQKNFNPSKSSMDGQSPASVKIPAKASRVSSLTTAPKENGRSAKVGSVEKNRSSSFGLKNNKTAEKQKETSREKSGARTVERRNLKAGVTDGKTRRHSLDPKFKPMQGSIPGTRGSSDKDGFRKRETSFFT